MTVFLLLLLTIVGVLFGVFLFIFEDGRGEGGCYAIGYETVVYRPLSWYVLEGKQVVFLSRFNINLCTLRTKIYSNKHLEIYMYMYTTQI